MRFLLIILFIATKSVAQTPSFQELTIENGLPNNQIYVVKEDCQGFVWIGTKNGLCRWDSKNFIYYTIKDGLPNNEVISMYEDSKRRMWLSTFSDELVYCFNGKIITKSEDTNLVKIKTKFAPDIFEFKDRLYYPSSFSSYSYLDFKKNKVVNFLNNKTIRLNHFKGSIVEFDYCAKSICLNGSNIKIYSPEIKEYALYNFMKNGYRSSDPLSTDNYILDTIVDKKYHIKNKLKELMNVQICEVKNSLYVLNNGISIYNDKKILNYPLKNYINRILYLDSNNFVGINDKGSLVDFLGNNKTNSKFNFTSVYNVVKYNNQWNIVTSGKVYFVDNNYNVTEDKELAEKGGLSNFKNLTIDRIHNLGLYSCGSFGAAIKNLNVQSSYTKITNDITYCMMIDHKGRLWRSGLDKVFYSHSYLPKIVNEKPFKLSNIKSFCSDIKEDKFGNIVFTTNNGVYINDNDNKLYRISTDNYLSSNECNKLIIDETDNSLWIATVNGLNHIKYSKNNGKISFEVINKFFTSDGLLSNLIYDIEVANNKVYVATNKGVSVIQDKNIRPIQEPIKIYLNSILINGEKKSIPDAILHLKYFENNITLNYSALYFQRRERLAIKLAIYKNDKLINQNSITSDIINLYSLSDGSYKFVISAYDIDYPNFNKGESSYYVTISPPFYKTWWFLLLLVLFLISLTSAIIYFNLKRKQKIEIDKAKFEKDLSELSLKSLRSQMNPHFIFNCLNSIKDFINKNDKVSSNKYLTDFAKLIRLTLNISRKQYVYIMDEIDYLELYIQLEQMRFDKRFDYHIQNNIPEELYVEIPSMLLQPFVENAIRHGQIGQLEYRGQLDIDINVVDKSLIIIVNDNGLGIEKTKLLEEKRETYNQSLALTILNEQIELIKKTYGQEISIDIKDRTIENKSGTSIIITIDIQEAFK